jgi:ParB family chromosome partitioning protein
MDTIKLSKIQPDETQARKYFDVEKLKQLKDNVKRNGIISPLLLEKIGDNYLIIDGERRYRVAKELELEEVPAVVEEAHSKSERLIRRFTVQEQHEAWTPIEKAQALVELSDEIGLTLPETCRLLNVGHGDTRRYVAFAELADKAAWIKSEIPLTFVEHMKTVRNVARRVSEQSLKEEFTHSDEKKLERRIIEGIMDGSIKRRYDITKLSDALNKDPKTLKKFLGDHKVTVQKLFLDSGAQGSNALRNVIYNAAYLTSHVNRFLLQPDVKISETQLHTLKRAKEAINKIVGMAD